MAVRTCVTRQSADTPLQHVHNMVTLSILWLGMTSGVVNPPANSNAKLFYTTGNVVAQTQRRASSDGLAHRGRALIIEFV